MTIDFSVGDMSRMLENDDFALRRTLLRQNVSALASRRLAVELLADDPLRMIKLREPYTLFGDLIDVERSRRGLLHTIDGLRDLIDSACDVAEVDAFAKKRWLTAIMEFERDLLRHSDKHPYAERLLKDESVIAYFLEHTRREVINVADPEGVPNRWRQLCVSAYRATRIAVDAETGASEDVTWERSKRSARAVQLVMTYLPVEVWASDSPRLSLSAGAVADAMRKSLGQEDYILTTAESYRRVATALFADRPYHWRRAPKGKRRVVKRRDFDEVETDLKSSLRDLAKDRWTDEKEEEISEGGTQSEMELPANVPTERASPPGSANRSYALQPVGVTPIWARSHLTAEVLGTALAWLTGSQKVEQLNTLRRVILSFVRAQIVYGFRAEILVEAKHALRPPTGGRLRHGSPLIYHAGTFYIRPRRNDREPVFANESDTSELYLPCSHTLMLPVPGFIKECLDITHSTDDLKSLEANNLFIVRGNGRVWRSLDIKTINRELKPLANLIGEPVDVSRIGRSAATLLTQIGGMNELTAAFVRGEVPRYLASQAHYTNQLIANVVRDHEKAYRRVYEHLFERSRTLIEHLKLTPLNFNSNPAFTNSSTMKAIQPIQATDERRLGSPFVPQSGPLRDYLASLRSSINETTDWRLGFNRLTAYTALTLMFLTGLRPIELKWLNHARLSINNLDGMLAVKAKLNQHHREWRSLELPMLAIKQLNLYRTYTEQAIDRLSRDYGRSPAEVETHLKGGLLFFIRQGFLPRPITTDALREYLNSKELETRAYERRLTCGRHLYRTTAMNQRQDSAVIDLLVGHTTRGREALGIFSMHDWRTNTISAGQIVECIIEQLNLELVDPTRWRWV